MSPPELTQEKEPRTRAGGRGGGHRWALRPAAHELLSRVGAGWGPDLGRVSQGCPPPQSPEEAALEATAPHTKEQEMPSIAAEQPCKKGGVHTGRGGKHPCSPTRMGRCLAWHRIRFFVCKMGS